MLIASYHGPGEKSDMPEPFRLAASAAGGFACW